MVAGTQPARYLRQGEIVEIPGPELFHHCWPDEVEGLGAFEIYPNRDALRYVELYGLDGIRNMIRCTCRYPGWVETMKAAVDLGLLSLAELDWPAGTTYASVTGRLLEPGTACLAQRIADRLGISVDSKIIARLEWAGLLSDRPIPETRCAPLDVLANRLHHLMRYQAGERDAVVLKHVFWVDLPDGSREEIRSTLVQAGDPWGDTAMARTVALPAAIATRLILSGGVSATGVQIPILKEIYQPVLAELAQRGISFTERHFRTFAGPFER
jgi:saccharopine dehydrogenase-like NADP-dependent oxidoreductase